MQIQHRHKRRQINTKNGRKEEMKKRMGKLLPQVDENVHGSTHCIMGIFALRITTAKSKKD